MPLTVYISLLFACLKARNRASCWLLWLQSFKRPTHNMFNDLVIHTICKPVPSAFQDVACTCALKATPSCAYRASWRKLPGPSGSVYLSTTYERSVKRPKLDSISPTSWHPYSCKNKKYLCATSSQRSCMHYIPLYSSLDSSICIEHPRFIQSTFHKL